MALPLSIISTFFNKTVMVIMLCLIFIGQSMASSIMFYKMTAMSTMVNMSDVGTVNTSMHVNMAHDMESVDSNKSTPANCCKQECQCFASGCSTPSAFSKTFTTDVLITSATKIHCHNEMILEQALTSLFRPPISS